MKVTVTGGGRSKYKVEKDDWKWEGGGRKVGIARRRLDHKGKRMWWDDGKLGKRWKHRSLVRKRGD